MHVRLLPKQMTYISPVGVDALGDPKSLRSQTKPLSVAEMLGLQKPSPVGEGGRHVIISSATPEKSIDNIPTKV